SVTPVLGRPQAADRAEVSLSVIVEFEYLAGFFSVDSEFRTGGRVTVNKVHCGGIYITKQDGATRILQRRLDSEHNSSSEEYFPICTG
ncbi:jg10857, partial [Pararge aegeria aegeria]